MSDKNEKVIAGLLRERDALTATGKTERVAQVDEQLKIYGYSFPEEKAAEKPPAEGKSQGDPKQRAPQGRSTEQRQNTSKDS